MKKLILLVCSFSLLFMTGCFNKSATQKSIANGNSVILNNAPEGKKTDKSTDIKIIKKEDDSDINIDSEVKLENNDKGEEVDKDEKKAIKQQKESRDEFDENGQLDPKKFQDDDVDDVMGLLKDLLSE